MIYHENWKSYSLPPITLRKNSAMPYKYKNSMTMSDAAEICQVSTSKMKRIFDKGLVNGYTVPDSKDRRVTPEALLDFMKEHKLPIPRGFGFGIHPDDVSRIIKQTIDNLENIPCDRTTRVMLNSYADELRKVL